MKQKYTMPTGEIVEKDMPTWKTPYNHDTNFESDRTAWYSDEPSMTKQEFKEEVDINVILERAMQSGQPPPMALPEHFGIVNRATYFDTATQIAEAQAMFYTLPASTRAEFLNDPNRWADAVVTAVAKGDTEQLTNLGIDATRKPQDGDKGAASTPVATPPANAAPAAPGAATPPGAPKSDPPK